jgi:hypothetical protein
MSSSFLFEKCFHEGFNSTLYKPEGPKQLPHTKKKKEKEKKKNKN